MNRSNLLLLAVAVVASAVQLPGIQGVPRQTAVNGHAVPTSDHLEQRSVIVHGIPLRRNLEGEEAATPSEEAEAVPAERELGAPESPAAGQQPGPLQDEDLFVQESRLQPQPQFQQQANWAPYPSQTGNSLLSEPYFQAPADPDHMIFRTGRCDSGTCKVLRINGTWRESIEVWDSHCSSLELWTPWHAGHTIYGDPGFDVSWVPVSAEELLNTILTISIGLFALSVVVQVVKPNETTIIWPTHLNITHNIAEHSFQALSKAAAATSLISGLFDKRSIAAGMDAETLGLYADLAFKAFKIYEEMNDSKEWSKTLFIEIQNQNL